MRRSSQNGSRGCGGGGGGGGGEGVSVSVWSRWRCEVPTAGDQSDAKMQYVRPVECNVDSEDYGTFFWSTLSLALANVACPNCYVVSSRVLGGWRARQGRG